MEELRKDDVDVTNKSDKIKLIPKMGKLEDQVRALFTRSSQNRGNAAGLSTGELMELARRNRVRPPPRAPAGKHLDSSGDQSPVVSMELAQVKQLKQPLLAAAAAQSVDGDSSGDEFSGDESPDVSTEMALINQDHDQD